MTVLTYALVSIERALQAVIRDVCGKHDDKQAALHFLHRHIDLVSVV